MGVDTTEFSLAGVFAVALLMVAVHLAAVYLAPVCVAGDGLKEHAGAGLAPRPGSRCATGFSLFELLIVVTFSGLLLQQAMIWKTHENDRAMEARTVRDIEQLRIALLSYYAQHNSYPPGLDPTVMIPSQPQFLGSHHLPAWNNVNAANILWTDNAANPNRGDPNPDGYGVVGFPPYCEPNRAPGDRCTRAQIITRLDSGDQAGNLYHLFETIAEMVRDPDSGRYTLTIELGRPPP